MKTKNTEVLKMKNTNRIIGTFLAITLLAITSQSAMALEVINSENDYEPALQNGWVDQAQLPVASFRSHPGHEIKFSGGSENDSGAITSTFTDTDHHANSNTNDPLSIDYIGNQ